jgi:hypothetical protein
MNVAIIDTATNTVAKTVSDPDNVTNWEWGSRDARRKLCLHPKSREQPRCGDRNGQQYSGHNSGCRTQRDIHSFAAVTEWFAGRKTPTWDSGLKIQAFLKKQHRKHYRD